MKLGKKEIESVIIFMLLITMSITTFANPANGKNKIASIPTQSKTAGISAAMEIDRNVFKNASIDDIEVTQVTAALNHSEIDQEKKVISDQHQPMKVVSPWETRVAVNVEGTLNVRETPDETGTIVGKMEKGNIGEIIENTGTWYKVQSGSVMGYVLGTYCLTGEQAEEFSNGIGFTYAVSLSEALRVRTAPDVTSSIATTIKLNTQLKVDTTAVPVEGWVAVLFNGKAAYTSSEFVEIREIFSTALTIEEYNAILKAAADAKKAAEAAQAAEAAKKAAQAAQSATVSYSNQGLTCVSVDDETLLAAIIYCEAGNQPYEGKLAVGAVVMNRIRSGRFPSSIASVIYQGIQFTPTYNGSLARALTRGISDSCRQAAQEAIAGVDNVNGALYFRRASSGKSGIVIGSHVFY